MFLNHKHLILVALILLFQVTVVGFTHDDTSGMVIFVEDEGDTPAIWGMNVDDASNPVIIMSSDILVANDIVDISSPVVSPDGNYIVMTGVTTAGDFEIFVYSFAQDQLTNLSNNSVSLDLDPSWNSDSQSVFFASDRSNGVLDLWQVGITNPAQPTIIFESSCVDRHPARSPDGLFLVFSRRQQFADDGDCLANHNLWLLRVGNGELSMLTSGEFSEDSDPAWASDSSRIAYTADLISGNSDILIADLRLVVLDNLLNITNTVDRNESTPTWSANNQHIIYASSTMTDGTTPISLDVFQVDIVEFNTPILLTSSFDFNTRTPNWVGWLNGCSVIEDSPGNCQFSVTNDNTLQPDNPPASPTPPADREGSCEHVVQSSETFFRIAFNYGYRVDELEPSNTHLGNVREIHPGNIVYIPDCSRGPLY